MTKPTYNELQNRIHVLEYENAGFKKDVETLKKEVKMSMEDFNDILIESLGNTDFFDWCNTGILGKEEVVDYIEYLEKDVEEMTMAMSMGCDINDWKNKDHAKRNELPFWVQAEIGSLENKIAGLKEINKTLMKN